MPRPPTPIWAANALAKAARVPLCLALAGCHWFSSPPTCSRLAQLGAREDNGRCLIAALDTAAYTGNRLPDNLTVQGNLQIYGERLDALPKGLVVEGNLCSDIPKTAKLLGGVRCE